MKQLLIAALVLIVFFVSCSKENKKTCWVLVDYSGLVLNNANVCDKTEAEMHAEYDSRFWFYNSQETVYCWKIIWNNSTPFYVTNLPQSIMLKLFPSNLAYSYTTVDCNSFCNWQILEKRKSKITGLFTPSYRYNETYFADSCTKLFEGRIVVYRETTDSIITREFQKKF